MHPDSYFELRDRAKEVIISGGENITSVEVEQAIACTRPCPRSPWSPRPTSIGVRSRWPTSSCGPGARPPRTRSAPTSEHLAGFKVPKRVIFAELPKTSTGKIQKTVLRDRSRTLAPRSARR